MCRALISYQPREADRAHRGDRAKFEFDQWEPNLWKYRRNITRAMIEELAAASGFSIETEFFDDEHFYLNSLWRPI